MRNFLTYTISFCMLSFSIGRVVGYDYGHTKAIKSCVEEPQECKETYQFFNLGENK